MFVFLRHRWRITRTLRLSCPTRRTDSMALRPSQLRIQQRLQYLEAALSRINMAKPGITHTTAQSPPRQLQRDWFHSRLIPTLCLRRPMTREAELWEVETIFTKLSWAAIPTRLSGAPWAMR